MMRCGYVLWLSTALSVLALGVSLKCYSCPAGSQQCEVTAQCSDGLDACLNLKASTGVVFTKCINNTECDFQKLAASFPQISSFTFNCCPKDLCNSSHSLRASPLIGLLAGVAALWWAMH